jgi:Conjugal transfer protein
MRPAAPIIPLLLGLAATVAHGQQTARLVKYHANDIVSVRARMRYTTLIELPATEKILEVATGDKDFWIIDTVGNYCFLHPAKEGIHSNLNLITDKGTVYSFTLDDVESGDPDLKVVIEPSDPSSLAAANGASQLVPASEVEVARAQVQAAATRAAAAVEQYRADYPTQALKFDYAFHDEKPFDVSATRSQIVTMYNLAYQMSKMPQNLEARYKTDWSQWSSLAAPPNAYGTSSALVNALNFGGLPQAQQGYNSAYVQAQSYPSGNYSSLDSRTQATVANQYATSELAQTTTTNTLATLGTIRTDEQQFASKLSNLDSDTFSTDPTQQTQNALLGKINSATLLQIHSQQDTNQLLMASIQQQLIAQKQQIDAQNRALNNSVYFQQNFPTTMQNVNNGVSDSMHSISLNINGSN